MSSEDLEYKPVVVEQAEFEYFPLGEALNNKVKNKTNQKNKVVNTDKQHKNLIYNLEHSFARFKEVNKNKIFRQCCRSF